MISIASEQQDHRDHWLVVFWSMSLTLKADRQDNLLFGAQEIEEQLNCLNLTQENN